MGFNEKFASKVYIGDAGGQAQMIVGPDGVYKYQGEIEKLTTARSDLAAATVGNYALFAGGEFDSNKYSSTVDIYDNTLTHSVADNLSQARHELVSARIGKLTLFAGGNSGSNSSVVDAYSDSLTRTDPGSLNTARTWLAAASTSTYALFSGGFSSDGPTSYVEGYDITLAHVTSVTGLSYARYNLAGASVNGYALFAGGYSYASKKYTFHNTVDAFDPSLSRSTLTSLRTTKNDLGGGSSKDYALFAGGYNGTSYSTVDAYSTSLTRITAADLSDTAIDVAITSLNNYVLFCTSAHVDVYDSDLVKTTTHPLSVVRRCPATAVGNYALFGGGYGNGERDEVEAYYAIGD